MSNSPVKATFTNADGSFKAVVDKRQNRIRFENETEEFVTLVIEPKAGSLPKRDAATLGDENDCPYGGPIIGSRGALEQEEAK